MKWLLVLLLAALPAFACDCECYQEFDYSKFEAARKKWIMGNWRSDLDGRIVCVGGNVFMVTGMDSETGQYHAIGPESQVGVAFDRSDYKIPISRGMDENNQTQYDCGMTDEEAKAKAKADSRAAEERSIIEKQMDAENKAYEEEQKRRCEVEPQNYPDDCGHVLNPPKEEEDEHTEPSPEDAGKPEQESGNETGPRNNQD